MNQINGYQILEFILKINKLIKQKKLVTTKMVRKILINIYSNLNSYFSTKNVEKNKSLTYKTFELINKINKTE